MENGSFGALRLLRTTEEWGEPVLLHVILSKPKACRRIRIFSAYGIRCGGTKAPPYDRDEPAYGIRQSLSHA